MHGAKLRGGFLGIAALAAIAAPAWGLDAGALDGEWSVQGISNKGGGYTGTVKISENAGTYTIKEEIKYASGKQASFNATGTATGDTIKIHGKITTGFIGALFGSGHKADLTGKLKVKNDQRIDASWSTDEGAIANERLTRAAPATAGSLLTLVDGDGKEVTGAAKLSKGVVLAPNIDDDDDAWQNGDGKVDIVMDKDRTNVQNEDDLLPIKLKKPAGANAGATWKLGYPTDKLAVWKTKTKNGRVESGKAFAADDVTLWVEGIASSKPGDGETLTVALEENGHGVASDAGRFKVARAAFLLAGHGNSGTYNLDDWLSSHKLDKRKDPVVVLGKEGGKPAAWAVYIWKTEKLAKFALATEDAVVAYDGHSNFGLGYAFETHFTNVHQFMNIAEPQVPVNWVYLREHQQHPDLMFADSDYADDASTPEFSDPVQVDAKYDGAHGHYQTVHYLASGSSGPNAVRCHLTRGTVKWQDNHFGSADDLRIVVKAGSRDMPAKRWSKLFLNSCYSGDYYHDSFGGRGTLFFAKDESSSPETSALFIEGFIEGKSNEDVLKDLNNAENINDFHVFGP